MSNSSSSPKQTQFLRKDAERERGGGGGNVCNFVAKLKLGGNSLSLVIPKGGSRAPADDLRIPLSGGRRSSLVKSATRGRMAPMVRSNRRCCFSTSSGLWGEKRMIFGDNVLKCEGMDTVYGISKSTTLCSETSVAIWES